ncbi:MAG: hypothetical protein ABI747_02960 [Candidatus Moraniibacteriota bacterium]
MDYLLLNWSSIIAELRNWQDLEMAIEQAQAIKYDTPVVEELLKSSVFGKLCQIFLAPRSYLSGLLVSLSIRIQTSIVSGKWSFFTAYSSQRIASVA